MSQEVKRRTYDVFDASGSEYLAATGDTNTRSFVRRGFQETWSTSTEFPQLQRLRNSPHITPNIRRALAVRDAGSMFMTQRTYHRSSNSTGSTVAGSGLLRRTYSGAFTAINSQLIGPDSQRWPQLGPFSVYPLWSLGSEAINAVRPSYDELNLAATLGEMREGLPSFSHRYGSFLRNLGGNYLTTEMAIKPVLNDARAIAQTARDYDTLLERMKSEAGKIRHRRYDFPDTISETVESVTTGQFPGGPLAANLTARGTLTVTLTRKTKTWFEGSFKYYMNDFNPYTNNATNFRRLYGLHLDAESLWELTRFSWLVDYFTSIGDVLANVSAHGRGDSVMIRGYLMRTTVIEREYVWEKTSGNTGVPSRITEVFGAIRKERVQAHPFGFGLSTDLTNRQWAIIAALGLTRR